MSNLLNEASLIVTPNGYKEGKLYSVIPSDGSGDMSVTRATTATRVNSAGLVELVPYNLLQYSEDFSNGVWSKSGATVTANNTIAPDGTMTADKIVFGAANNYILQGYAQYNLGNCSHSIYVKGTAGETIHMDDGYIAIPNVVLTGNWQRIDWVSDRGSTQNQGIGVGTYNGATARTIYLWGAQLNEGTLKPYQKTETRLNIPRIDYSLGGCPNILLEPQRTNLLTYSEDFSNAAWLKSNTTVTANSITAPNGTLTADTITHSSTSADIWQLFSGGAGIYTYTIYVKYNNVQWVRPFIGDPTNAVAVWFDIQNGIVGSNVNVGTATLVSKSIENVGSGWYRLNITVNLTSTSGNYFQINTAQADGNSTRQIGSFYLWGAQLEVGAYPTSYIPTATASVTRNADIITRNNIFTNGLITAAGGTWFVEFRNNLSYIRDFSTNGISLTDATILSFGFRIKTYAPNNRLAISKVISGTETPIYTTLTNTAKIAIKWNGTTSDVFVNGVKQVSATAFTDTAMQTILSNLSVPMFLNEMALFPTPLSDDELEALTGQGFDTYAAMASYYNYTLQ